VTVRVFTKGVFIGNRNGMERLPAPTSTPLRTLGSDDYFVNGDFFKGGNPGGAGDHRPAGTAPPPRPSGARGRRRPGAKIPKGARRDPEQEGGSQEKYARRLIKPGGLGCAPNRRWGSDGGPGRIPGAPGSPARGGGGRRGRRGRGGVHTPRPVVGSRGPHHGGRPGGARRSRAHQVTEVGTADGRDGWGKRCELSGLVPTPSKPRQPQNTRSLATVDKKANELVYTMSDLPKEKPENSIGCRELGKKPLIMARRTKRDKI